MFYRNIVNISIFLLTLLSFTQLYEAQNSDSVLKLGNDGYLEMNGIAISGKGLSICTWFQLENSKFIYFTAYSYKTEKYSFISGVDFNKPVLAASVSNEMGKAYFVTEATDCNLNKADWFHICVAKDQSSFNIYYNGYALQNYTSRVKFDDDKSDEVTFKIGAINRDGKGNSMYQLNIFDRAVTEKEAVDFHNCKPISGDLLSWKDVTEKSSSIEFKNSIELVQKPAPCPNPPEFQPINCETGQPIQQPGNANPGSDSKNSSSGLGSGSPTSSSGNSGQPSGSGSGSPTSSSGNSGQPSGSGSGSPTSSSGNSDQPSGSGSGSPTSSSGNPSSISGNSNSGTSSQNMNTAQSPATSGS